MAPNAASPEIPEYICRIEATKVGDVSAWAVSEMTGFDRYREKAQKPFRSDAHSEPHAASRVQFKQQSRLRPLPLGWWSAGLEGSRPRPFLEVSIRVIRRLRLLAGLN